MWVQGIEYAIIASKMKLVGLLLAATIWLKGVWEKLKKE